MSYEPIELDWCVECGDEPSEGAKRGNLCGECCFIKCSKEGCNNKAAKKRTDSDCWGEHDCGFCLHRHYWNLCEKCFAEDCPNETDGEDEEDEDETDGEDEPQYTFACCGAKGAYDPEDWCSDCIMLSYKIKRICGSAPKTKEEYENLACIAEESRWIDIKPYSHNIVSLTLRMLEEDHHYDEEKIKLVVKTFGLDKKGWGYLLVEK